MNTIVFVSGVQPSDSALHRQASTLFPNLFLFGSLQNIEQSSLCYAVGAC